jgi:hypothetical protein
LICPPKDDTGEDVGDTSPWGEEEVNASMGEPVGGGDVFDMFFDEETSVDFLGASIFS